VEETEVTENSTNLIEPSPLLPLSIIIPVRNEEEILWDAVSHFAGHFDRVVGASRWQFVLVENGCSDRSPEIVRRITEHWPNSIALHLERANYGNALRQGMLAGTGEWSLIINVDHLWDSPFFEWAWAHRRDYDMILGSKRADPTLNMQGRYRRVLSAGLNMLLHGLFDFVGADSHGMKLMNNASMRPLAEACEMRRGQFDTELTLRALRGGYWVAEAPVPYREKRRPRNFMFRKIAQNFLDLFRLYGVMNQVDYQSEIRYHRVCRADLTHRSCAVGSNAKMTVQSGGPQEDLDPSG
jgi:glycosyltransferase involved in cell wall biosynthesis